VARVGTPPGQQFSAKNSKNSGGSGAFSVMWTAQAASRGLQRASAGLLTEPAEAVLYLDEHGRLLPFSGLCWEDHVEARE